MEKTASTPIQLFRGMTADELAALFMFAVAFSI